YHPWDAVTSGRCATGERMNAGGEHDGRSNGRSSPPGIPSAARNAPRFCARRCRRRPCHRRSLAGGLCHHSQCKHSRHRPADLAESWEQPDELTYVFKLRPNAKFQNIAPVNGREVVAEDVKYSFERQIALKINAGRLPQFARIESVDAKTVKIVTPKPDADFL